MLSASFAFRRAIAQNTKTLLKATLTLADGTARELAGDDLMMGSASFTDSVSSAGSFDVGAAIIGRMALSLNNCDGRFDDYDFEGSELVSYVGVRLGEDTVEWLRKGVYGVEQPETYGNVIGVDALDNMRKLEGPYSEVPTTYPATLGTIARDICDHCGVTLATPAFANSSFVVEERPDDSSLTCIAALAFVAQASGNWARCDAWGRVRLDWYDTSSYEGEDWLDGDRFDEASPYASGDTASGGDFVTYDGGDSVDGGGFSLRPWAHVFAIANFAVATDDVVVTGVRVTAQDGEDDQEGETALYGAEGYVLDLPDNPLVQYGTAQAVAAQVGARVVGMRFRPFDIAALGDPTLEAGDPIIITDAKQRQYRSYVTTLTYKVGSYEAISCNAESPGRNKASSYSALTQAIVKLRNANRDERTAREIAVANLARQLAESSGLFMTEEPQQDGSTIYYMHDKPTLRESTIVWKLTANALGISTDGGRTYPYGLDVSGDAILNRVYAIGLNADYINSGAITIREDGSEDGDTVFSADADTGIVFFRDRFGNYIDSRVGFRLAATSTMGGRTVESVLDTVDSTVTDVRMEYAQNQSTTNPPTSGWSTDSPAWREGWYIWQRMVTVSGGTSTPSNVVCISGRDGSSGTNASSIYLYQRSATAPAKPSASLTYTFSTGELAGPTGAWTRGIPDGSDTCWVIMASAISNGATDTITPSEWSDPVELAAGGVDGLNQAFIYLHKRAKAWRADSGELAAPAASALSVSGTTATVAGTVSGTTLALASEAPAAPGSTLTYTFASGALSGNLDGWTREIPDGDDPCWVTTAVAISSEGVDTIAPSEWAEVVKLVEDGKGFSIEAVEYAIGASDATPPTTGWQDTIPTVPDGSWLWTRTTYSDGSETLVCSYQGIGIVHEADQYYLSTSDEEPTGGTWGMTQPEWEMGRYVWKRKALTWSDGTTTYTEPILSRGVNDASESAYRANEAVTTLDDELDQEGVFNRLTNNGQVQGIYLEDSKLYINASYIMTGIMNASLIRAGALVVGREGRTVFSANFETGAVSIDSDCITVGSESLTSTVRGMRAQYGTCETTAATRAKAVACENFALRTGATVSVRFTYSNSAASPTLNVNGTGAKPIQLNGAAIPEGAWWKAGETVTFVYDGTNWVVTDGAAMAQIVTNRNDISTLTSTAQQFDLSLKSHAETLTQLKATYCTSVTEASTTAKVASCENFALRTGAIVSVRFTYSNTAANPTLNVNGTGAKPIRLNGGTLPEANWWKAGDLVTLVYDGAAWSVADGATLSQLKATNDSVAALVVRADSFEATVKGVQATYGICPTAADTQLKEVTIADFKRYVGQTVTVKFTYANTASYPRLSVRNADGSETATGYIYVNNSYISSDQYWGAQGVLTLVWDGTYWRVGDGYTMSSIKALKDNLALSVTNGTLGNTASIVLSAYGSQLDSASINLSGVRNAFRDDTTAITITAGRVTFNSGTFVVNSTYFRVTSAGVITATSGTIGGFTISTSSIYNTMMTLDGDGLSLKRNGVQVGNIGTNNMTGYSYQRGLVFDLEASGNYMAWATKDSSSDTTYKIKLLYARSTTNGYTTGRLSVSCNLDLKNYTAYNFWIDPNTGGADGGKSFTMRFVQVLGVRSDGTVSRYGGSAYITFKNGLCTGVNYYE